MEDQMKRKTVKTHVVVLSLFCCVASGAYGIEDMVGESGPGMTMLILVVLSIVWALPYGLANAEQGSIWPDTGGAVAWGEKIFGRYWGFHDGFISVLGGYADLAVYLVWISEYSEWFIEDMSFPIKALICTLTAGFLIYINIRGIDSLTKSLAVFAVIILVPFIVMTIMGFIQWQYNPVMPFTAEGQTTLESVSAGILVGIWMFSGYDEMAFFAGEIKGASRIIPKALFIVSPIIVVSYLLPTLAGLASVGQWQDWTTEGNGLTFVEIGTQIGGKGLGFALWFGMVVGSVATFTELLGTVSRTTYYLSRRRMFFKSFGKLHAKYNSPYIGILVAGIAALLLSLFCNFEMLIIVESCIYWLYYVSMFMTTYFRRKKYPDQIAPYTIPVGNKALLVMMAFPSLLLTWAIFQEDFIYIMATVVINLLLPFLYLIFRKMYGVPLSEEVVLNEEDE